MKITSSLRDNYRFKTLYYRGKSSVKKTMAVYVLKNRTKTVNCLGITVSAKLGCAVVRNRMRRRLKEVYRLNEQSLDSGYDIVLVARKACESAPFSVIERDFLLAMQELSVFKNT